ncbi:MAG: hypothetical protein ACYCYI_01030 [Saccharofermentanales bacterium]
MKKTLKEQLKNPDNMYRPIPFWSWNENLSCEETEWQIDEMNKKGIGGYFMHARGGLQTKYMGDEWMDNIRVGIDEGKKRDMGAWGYDENGWPSGFANGEVNGLGIEYQQKYLRMKETGEMTDFENAICVKKSKGRFLNFYFDVNPFYVDVLDAKVTAKFLELVHEKYKEKLGSDFSSLTGFFTDEPQISRNGIPWSLTIEDEYMKKYSENLKDSLEDLFIATKTSPRTRFRYWSLVRDLFTENFMKQIYDWCNANGTKLTGHMVLEETLHSQLTSNASCMPNYEYMHIPGMDWLTRNYPVNNTSLQLSSVGHQLGKKQMISETFALSGWNVSFEELKWLFEAQMVRGVNLLCQHLEGYTLRGIRKRDYPASLFYQQPWWDDYELFNSYVSRIGVLLTEGSVRFKVLVLHPQSSAWTVFDNSGNEGLGQLDNEWSQLLSSLEENQINFHLGDEKIIERHGKIDGGRFVIGGQNYEAVIVPPSINMSSVNLALLKRFKEQNGKIIFSSKTPYLIDGEESAELADFIKTCSVMTEKELIDSLYESYCVMKIRPATEGCDARSVYVTSRSFDSEGYDMLYIVNSGLAQKDLILAVPYKKVVGFDPMNGGTYPVPFVETQSGCEIRQLFEARGSLVLFGITDDKEWIDKKPAAAGKSLVPGEKTIISDKKALVIDPEAQWTIKGMDPNAITLDYCDCYFDGEIIGKHIPVNNIQEMACALKRPVDIKLVFSFNVGDAGIAPVSLVIETPEKFGIYLNGVPVENTVTGYYQDKSFKTISLGSSLLQGINEITCKMRFEQTPEVYENISKSLLFESEKNKLTYDDEIEAIYIIGDFAVKTDGNFKALPDQAVSCKGDFTLVKKPESIALRSIVTQGFPFFSGKMHVAHTIVLAAGELQNRVLRFGQRSWNNIKVIVNGKRAGDILWAPYEVSLDGLLVEGANTIEIIFVGTLRNLLGPHHLDIGESFCVGPFSFFEKSPLWVGGNRPFGGWVDSYCFVDFVGPLA